MTLRYSCIHSFSGDGKVPYGNTEHGRGRVRRGTEEMSHTVQMITSIYQLMCFKDRLLFHLCTTFIRFKFICFEITKKKSDHKDADAWLLSSKKCAEKWTSATLFPSFPDNIFFSWMLYILCIVFLIRGSCKPCISTYLFFYFSYYFFFPCLYLNSIFILCLLLQITNGK